MKKITALLLTALLAVSISACNNNGNTETSGSVSANSEITASDSANAEANGNNTPALELDTDTDLQKSIEEKIDMEKLGPLSKYAVSMIENKNLTVSFNIEYQNDEEESSSDESSTDIDLSAITGGDMSVSVVKNAQKDYRIKLEFGLFAFDFLKNSEGLFRVNTNTKSYQIMKTAEEVQKMENEASENSGSETSEAMKSLNDITGGMFDGINTDALIKDTGDKEVTYNGDGTEDYNGESYKFESYTVKSKAKQTSDASQNNNSESTAEIKVYFGDDNIMKIIHIEADKNKVDFVFNKLSVSVDEDELKIPAEYELKETSEFDLSELGIDLSDISIPDIDISVPDISLPDDISLSE